jgi:hypothetical protein
VYPAKITAIDANTGALTLNNSFTSDLTTQLFTYIHETTISSPTVNGNAVSVNDGAGTTASFNLVTLNSATSNAGSLKVGAYQLDAMNFAATSLTKPNFNALAVVGDLTVTQKALTPTVNNSAKSKTYDGTAAMSGLSLTSANILSGDAVNIGSDGGAFTDKNVSRDNGALAANKSYSVSGINLSGNDAANYYLSANATISASDGQITPKTLTVIYTGVDKVYDRSATATVTTSDDRVIGDNLGIARTASFVITNGETAAKDVLYASGNPAAKNISITNATLSGSDALNYSLTSATGSATATITPASLVISGIVGVDKTYDRALDATLVTTGLQKNGLISGDTVTVTATGAFADYNAGIGKGVTISSSYSGADAGNYTITGQTGTTASINKRQVAVSAAGGISKVYDGTTDMNGVSITVVPVTNVTDSGVVNGDTVDVSGTGSFSSANVSRDGSGTVLSNKSYNLSDLQLSGASANNYMIVGGATSITGNDGRIDPKTLTMTGFSADNKVYDGNNTATILNAGSLSGVVGADDVTVSNSGATFNNQNAADNSILQSS